MKVLTTIRNESWSEEEQEEVRDLVNKLVLAQPVAKAAPPDEEWVQLLPGEYGLGTIVRVHDDAYPPAIGHLHNGKRGRILGVRGSKAVVLYDDAQDSEDHHYHDPMLLDRLA